MLGKRYKNPNVRPIAQPFVVPFSSVKTNGATHGGRTELTFLFPSNCTQFVHVHSIEDPSESVTNERK